MADQSGATKAVWFNQAWLAERLRPGTRLLLSGKLDRSGFRVSAHELLHGDGLAGHGLHTVGLVPVHSVTDGLSADRVREWAWRSRALARDAIEALPAELRARRRLAGAGDALFAVHFPDDAEAASAARERLAFEELFLHQVALASRRRGRERTRPGVPLEPPGELSRSWLDSLPFTLTDGQRTRLCRNRRRPRVRASHAAAPDGRGGERQDRRCALRHAPGGRGRAAGRAHGADRDAGRAARADRRPAARGLDDPVHPHHRLDARREPAGRAGQARDGRARAGRRDPRADRARRRVRAARPLCRGRAAPLRRAPASRARRQGAGRRRPAHSPHDRDADPAHALADRVRRSGHHRPSRATGGSAPRQDLGRGGGEAPWGVRVRARTAARGPPGVLRLPAGRGLGEGRGEGRRQGGGTARGRRAAGLRRRASARADACAR